MEAAVAGTVLQEVDPRLLLVDANVRIDARLDAAFVQDIRERGVRQPITANPTADGRLRVKTGHRRTLAAIEARCATVPVLVTPAEGSEVDRIVDQWAENEHRLALTAAERVGVVEQLTAFGLGAAQVAKRLKVKRAVVDAAVAAAASDLAKAAAQRYAVLTLEQAAVLAEFDQDPETVKALVAAAHESPGSFDHVAQRARDDREQAAREQAARDAIAASGVTVVDGAPPWFHYDGPSRKLSDLLDSEGTELTAARHADCPGHAAHLGVRRGEWTDEEAATVLVHDEPGHPNADDLDPDDDLYDDEDPDDHDGGATAERRYQARYAAIYVCTDYAAHGHRPRWETGGGAGASAPAARTEAEEQQQREAARAERRRVIDNNKAWRSAETVRRAHLQTLVKAKTPPKDAPVWVARMLASAPYEFTRQANEGHPLACELLGVERHLSYRAATGPGLLELLDGATPARAQVISLGLILAALEAATGTHSWRQVSGVTASYLNFLGEHGYTLSDVERLACGDDVTPDPVSEPDA